MLNQYPNQEHYNRAIQGIERNPNVHPNVPKINTVSPVEGQLEIISKLLAEQQQLISDLGIRLQPVRMPMVSDSKSDDPCGKDYSPIILVAKLENFNILIEQNNFAIRSLIQSLAI